VVIFSLAGFTTGVTTRESVGATDSRKLNMKDDTEPSESPEVEYFDRSMYTDEGVFVYAIALQHSVVNVVFVRNTSERLFPTPVDVST
jgi:hypothetical protein